MERAIDFRGLTTPSDAQVTDQSALVGAARRGDRSAFGQLYVRFFPMVHGILLARVPRAEAEDLVHDVFLAALRRLHMLRDDAAFPGWLAMIARNRANDHHRRNVTKSELSDEIAARDGSVSEGLEVLCAIRSLPEAYREPLILRLVEGLTGEEIASHTGLTPASVRVNLHRGMKRLRDLLRKEGRP